MTTPADNEKTENNVTFMSTSPEPMPASGSTNDHDTDLDGRATFRSEAQSQKVVRPAPFSRKLTRGLFIRPASSRGPAPGYLQSFRSALTYSWLNVLLICNPIAWALHYTHQVDGAVFAVALLGVMPLAGLLGHGTETIALYTGDALGGLVNASLGNATEFIIAILLLVKCELRVVQASLLGGLLSNLLLVTGMAFLVGGIRFSEQEFQQSAAQLNTSLLTLAVIALVLPTVFAFAIEQASNADEERSDILEMSRGSALILIFIYISYLVFQLYSHSHLYNPNNDVLLDSERSSVASTQSRSTSPEPAVVPNPPIAQERIKPVSRTSSVAFGSAAALGWGRQERPNMSPRMLEKENELRAARRATMNGRDLEAALKKPAAQGSNGNGSDDDDEEKETPEMNITVALIVLVAATGLTYLTAEALTDSLEGIGSTGAVSTEWLGLVLLAIVGNAAEHFTAVFVAYRNKVDLALAVSVGSCIQISLFVIPVLVIIGWIIGKPLSLLFDPLEVVTLFLSVLLVRFSTEDGRTHYMSGVALFGSYILIAFSFWYYPQGGTSSSNLFADECRS